MFGDAQKHLYDPIHIHAIKQEIKRLFDALLMKDSLFMPHSGILDVYGTLSWFAQM